MMNYAQVTDQIEQLKIGKNTPDTERLLKLFSTISELSLPGKVLYLPASYEEDSIGEFSEAILKEHKLSVGRFTSFSIKRPLGHILLNGKTISQKEFARIGEQILNKAGMGEQESDVSQISDLTQMEIIFLIALTYFSEKNCDYVILPKEEKAILADLENVEFGLHKRTLQKQIFGTAGYENLEICMASKKEAQNSVSAIWLLQKEGLEIKEKLLRKALCKCKGEGKFEVLKSKPYFIADGADNGASVKILLANLQYYFPENSYIFLVGALQDGYEEIVKESALLAQQIITVTPPEMQNALPAIELAREYGKLNPNITNTSSMEEAMEIASILAGKETVVVAFGSTTILERFKKVILA